MIEAVKKKRIDEVILDELTEGGLGNDIYKESLEFNGNVNTKNFLIWLYVESHGLRIIDGLIEDFKSIELLEHYNDYYKIRVPRLDKSIGYVFGLIETNKEIFGISEYSVG